MTPKFLPADMPSMHIAIRDWLCAQIATTGPSGAPVDPTLLSLMAAPYVVVWEAQDGPSMDYPYATLHVVDAPKSVGGKPVYTVEGSSSKVSRLEYDSRFTVRAKLLSRAPLDELSGVDEVSLLIHALEATLSTSKQIEAFGVAGLALISNTQPVLIPSIVGFGFERRAYFDIVFGARTRIDVSNPPILDNTSVPVDGTIDVDGLVHGHVGL